MHLHLVDYVLWLMAPCLQVCILMVMHKRGLDRDLPFFYWYLIVQAVSVACLVVIKQFSYAVYFYSYWAAVVLSVLTGFAVMHELFRLAFLDWPVLHHFGSLIFRGGAVVVLVVACMVSLDSHGSPQIGRLAEGLLLADRCVRYMLCGLAILLLLVSSHLGMSRRNIAFGTALGFTFFTSIRIVLESTVLQRPGLQRVIGRINSLAYITSCCVWLGYAVLGDKASAMAVIPASLAEPSADEASIPWVTTLFHDFDSMLAQLKDKEKKIP